MEISETEAREEYVRRIQNEILRRKAKTHLSDFIRYLHPDYMMGWVHQEICDTLDKFIADVKARKAPRLIICMPPRSGKSEIVSRNFPAYAFGVNPDLQIISCSYSADLTSRFNRDVQRIIDDDRYRQVFPDTQLNSQRTGSYIRTSDLFEIVDHKGAYRSTGVGGGITGQGAECVTADSVILTTRGNKSITRIHAGDTVIGYNINTGKLEPCLVEAVRVKNATKIYRLCSNSGRSLKVTSNHPIFSNGEYIQANILAKGAPVLCAVRTRIYQKGLRVPQELYTWCTESFLQSRVFKKIREYTGQRKASLRDLWRACSKTTKVLSHLFSSGEKVQGWNWGSSCCENMPSMWQRIFGGSSWSRKIRGILLEGMRGQTSLTGDEEQKKYQIQRQHLGKTQVKTSPKRAISRQKDNKATLSRMFCLWSQIQFALSSHRFKSIEQCFVKLGKAVRSMSYSGSPRGSGWDLRAEYITENQKISVDESVVVYDLQVAKCHNFFANGFLVHNCLIIDDPFKDRAEANSATIREKVWDWYTSTAYTRLSDGGGVIVMATRWHQEDLIGRLIRHMNDGSGDKFMVINYPAIAEHDEPHRKVGEALHPERFSLERLQSIRQTIGSRDWSALYQQHPVPDGGAVFKLDTYKRWNDTNLPPKFDRLIGSWDLTFKDAKSSDYVVGQIWGTKGIDYYLLDQVRGQWDFTKTLEVFVQLAKKYPSVNRWLIEDKANGSAIISMLKKHIHGVTAITPTESKLERAYSVTPMIECGNVYIPEKASWLPAYEDELLSFPAGAHDDQVDSMTQALNWCRTHHKAQVSAQNLLALRRGAGFYVRRRG